MEKCRVKVGKLRYRVISRIYIYTHTRTHVALPQRQGFLRDIKFLINRISGSKVEERRKKAGRKDAQARPRKPLERDFRRGARDTRAEEGEKRGGRDSARDIRFTRLAAIKRPTIPVKHAFHFSLSPSSLCSLPRSLHSIISNLLGNYVFEDRFFVQNCAVKNRVRSLHDLRLMRFLLGNWISPWFIGINLDYYRVIELVFGWILIEILRWTFLFVEKSKFDLVWIFFEFEIKFRCYINEKNCRAWQS